MSAGDWIIIGLVNVILIGVGVLAFSGKIDELAGLNRRQNYWERKKIDSRNYRKWSMILCVGTALCIDLFVVFFCR